MNYSFLITVSLALGWMLSPDSLVLQGNGAGLGTVLFLPALAMGGVISSACIFLLHHPGLNEVSDRTPSPPAAFIIASRLSLVLLLPTGMLVTAGFTFNETFVHWFPNFGFSFLLLASVLVLHLIGERIAAAIQPVFIGTTFVCLLLLSIYGAGGGTEIQTISAEPPFLSIVPLTAATLVLFLGYDPVNGQAAIENRTYYWGAVGTACLLFAFWALASLANVDSAELAHSTIPYSLAARGILGQPGRIIIGIAIISGTLGCVNGLFILANKSLVPLIENFSLRFPAGKILKDRIYPLFFSVIIGTFMAIGMAGSDDLEIYIRGALMLWLLTIGVHCLTATRILCVLGKAITGFGYTLSITLIFSTFYLIYSHPQNVQVLGFCCFSLASSSIVSKGLLQLNKPIVNTDI